MKLWQMWLIIFYVCIAQLAGDDGLIGMAIGAFLAAVGFGVARR